MKGIPLKTWELCAILGNRKTAMRRIMKPQPMERAENPHKVNSGNWYFDIPDRKFGGIEASVGPCQPPCRPGDILYVRETWQTTGNRYIYKADVHNPLTDDIAYKLLGWRPSIHMPREAARIFLRVKDVRVEKLQNITDDGAIQEGIQYTDFGTYLPNWKMSIDGGKTFHNPQKEIHHPGYHVGNADTPDQCYPTARGAYHALWDGTIKPRDRALCGWKANPWVWVIEFEQINKPEVIAP